MNDRTKQRPIRRMLAAVAAVAMTATVISVLMTPASATKPGGDGAHKVTICHATHSNTNPYVVITVDYSAANGSLGKGGGDHTRHDGPVWSAGLKADHVKWGDIIPPYTYSGGTFPGLNWTEDGQAIHAAGCGAPTEPPPPPPPSDN